MSHRFVRCPHCKLPHDAAERVCPTTGRRIENASSNAGARSRMSELPPPERRPEPLGFDPARHRIAEREAARIAELQRPSTGTLQPTRNVQTDFIGKTVSDRYVIKGVLGEGGMGTVYEAEHLGLARLVAIKVLSPSQAKKRVAVKRFQQEARAAGAIGHPNICEVYDLGSLDDGSPYLVMEKLVGTTLADRISREGGLPFDEIADVMIQVLSGLIAAHDKGIVHRDIKPENIFLARRVGSPPIVKILDFGVSKMMPQFQGGDEQLDLTRTGMVMGTPYYMSPEQARGERNLDGRVDVYACGVMMYEAIVGKRPYLAPNYNALLLAIINTTPRPLREARPATPPTFEAIVTRAMAKARDDRYPSANAMLREIQSLPSTSGASAPVPANRMPAPPTADERMRAQILGGQPRSGRPAPTAASTASAGATLRSRMADAQPPSRGTDNSTRLDIRVQDARGGRRTPAQRDHDSVEIPIHITGSDLIPISGTSHSAGGAEQGEEMPTEIFRPGMHPYPPPQQQRMSSRSPSATRIAPAPAPGQAGQPRRPAAGAAPVAPPAGSPLAHPAPVSFAGLGGDDWDGETVVRRPAALTTSKHRDRPGREPPPPQKKPFNPDETVNLNGDIDVEIDFGDETQHMAAPRRPPR
jgi:serine/threonine-protein kinase